MALLKSSYSSRITVKHQLQKKRGTGGVYELTPTKNGKPRVLTPAPAVMDILKQRRKEQNSDAVAAGKLWKNNLFLVFTHKDGSNICPQTLYLHFKEIARKIGRPDARFHDLRHSFAVISLKSGDDIKTVQENLGHHTAAFTLQTYAHATDEMKRASATRMQSYITSFNSENSLSEQGEQAQKEA